MCEQTTNEYKPTISKKKKKKSDPAMLCHSLQAGRVALRDHRKEK